MKTKLIVLLLLTLLAAGLRLPWLSLRPLGFTWDEAALGYNAYSLLKTGKDEHSVVLPLVLQSFGDFKPALYAYFTVPSVAALGLNEFATRLPSALMGILAVPLLFVLASQLFGTRVGLFSAFIFAITPWSIHFSRGAWEANLALTLTILATALFFQRRYLPSSFFFVLTFYTYQGAKLFTPLLLASLALIYVRRLSFRRLLSAGLLGIVLLIPLLLGFSHQSGRLQVFSLFSYPRSDAEISRLQQQDSQSSPLVFSFFHPQSWYILRIFVLHYGSYFSPRFLFFAGDWTNFRHNSIFQGNLLLPQLILLVLGLVQLLRLGHRPAFFVFAWLLVAPLPAALSRDLVSGVRSLPLIIPLALIAGFGLARIFNTWLWRLVSLAALGVFLVFYLDSLFIHSPHYTAVDWLYPYRPIMETIKANISDYDRVVISPTLGQPYIFWLFYTQVDPQVAQSQLHFVGMDSADVGEVSSFQKLEFRKYYWPDEMGNHSVIYVGNQYEIPLQDISRPYMTILSTINYPNGLLAVRVVGLK